MLGRILNSGLPWVSWVFSKNSLFFVGIILCIGFWFVWRNAVERLEVRTIIFEERLEREQALVLSWKGEALRLQGLVKSSSSTLKRCLEREGSTSQAQAMVRTLVRDVRQKARETKSLSTNTADVRALRAPCSGHERVMEYLGRPLALP